MRALITNDDGIDSEGIAVLARVAHDAGLDLTVAAPSWDSSGASASLTAVEQDGRVLFERRTLRGLPEVDAFAVEAAPALIVRLATTGAFGEEPELVLSGINHGLNTGRAVLHSGTVGAALTAATHGCRALAISLALSEEPRWDTAAQVAAVAIDQLMRSGGEIVLNVNVPDVAPENLRSLERAHLAAFGAVTATITERGAGYIKVAYAGTRAEPEEGTDVALLAQGHPTYTPLLTVCEDRDFAAV